MSDDSKPMNFGIFSDPVIQLCFVFMLLSLSWAPYGVTQYFSVGLAVLVVAMDILIFPFVLNKTCRNSTEFYQFTEVHALTSLTLMITITALFPNKMPAFFVLASLLFAVNALFNITGLWKEDYGIAEGDEDRLKGMGYTDDAIGIMKTLNEERDNYIKEHGKFAHFMRRLAERNGSISFSYSVFFDYICGRKEELSLLDGLAKSLGAPRNIKWIFLKSLWGAKKRIALDAILVVYIVLVFI